MASDLDTRSRLVAAARALFAQKGLDGATTAEIARRAGVAEGTIYRHFRDKQELFLACLQPALEEFDQRLPELADAPDLRTAVRAYVEARVRVIARHMESYTMLISGALHHPELMERCVEQAFLPRVEQLGPVVGRLLPAGQVRRPPSFAILGPGLAVAIWAILYFRGRWRLLQERLPLPPGDDSLEQLVDDLTELLLYGLSGHPDTDSPSPGPCPRGS